MSKTSKSTGVIFGVKVQMMRHIFVICKHFEVVFHKKKHTRHFSKVRNAHPVSVKAPAETVQD